MQFKNLYRYLNALIINVKVKTAHGISHFTYFLYQTFDNSSAICSRYKFSEKQARAEQCSTVPQTNPESRPQLRTVYVCEMGAADFFVSGDCLYVTLSLWAGPRLFVITAWSLRQRGTQPAFCCTC